MERDVRLDVEHLIEEAREHWKRANPEAFEELRADGTLEKTLRSLAESAVRQCEAIIRDGFDEADARGELVGALNDALTPPPEPDEWELPADRTLLSPRRPSRTK